MPEPTLLLRPLTTADEAQALLAERELAADGFDFLVGRDGRPFDRYVELLAATREGRDLPPGYVPATFLVGLVDGDLVGRVSVRHQLNEHLARVGGHIGYGVRPGFRRRGYATALLRGGLAITAGLGIEQALETCDDANVASSAVIERCGGVLQDVLADGAARVRRYLVPTSAVYTSAVRTSAVQPSAVPTSDEAARLRAGTPCRRRTRPPRARPA